MNVTKLVIWCFGVANTSTSVSMQGYLRNVRPTSKQISRDLHIFEVAGLSA